MLQSILENADFLKLILWITTPLFLLSLGRIYSLARANRTLRKDNSKMETWALSQQAELTSMHHDAQSWRAKTQRQFDAVRADLGARLAQSERSNQHAQKKLDSAQERALVTTMARISELEAALKATSAPAQIAPIKAKSEIPALTAIETLQAESATGELAALKEESDLLRKQNAELQRAILLARRKRSTRRRAGSPPKARG